MLTKRAVLSPVDRADLAHCRYAAASQPAQGTGRKKRTGLQKNVNSGSPKQGPKMDPKMGPNLAALLRILLRPDFGAHFWDHFWDPKLGPKIDQKMQKTAAKKPKKSGQLVGPGIREKVSFKGKPRPPGNHQYQGPHLGLSLQWPFPHPTLPGSSLPNVWQWWTQCSRSTCATQCEYVQEQWQE